jgi:hypothetical protein
LVVIMYTTYCNITTIYFDHSVYLCVSCYSENKNKNIIHSWLAITDWYL